MSTSLYYKRFVHHGHLGVITTTALLLAAEDHKLDVEAVKMEILVILVVMKVVLMKVATAVHR